MDIQQLRAETKGCAELLHFNNAGASLMPDVVVERIKQHLDLETVMGGYEAANATTNDQVLFYHHLATLLNCMPSNIACTSNATDAYARALSAIPFKKGDVILTSTNDYVSNYVAFISLAKRFGVKLEIAENSADGTVDLEDLSEKIKKFKPKLVAITHVPTNSGLVQPVEAIGEICAADDVLYLVDGCQSFGQIPLDMQKIKCDFFSATFRKFMRGPRGMGFLYVSQKVLDMGLEPLFIDLSGANWTAAQEYAPLQTAKRFGLWELPIALMMGASKSVEYALEIGMGNIEKRVTFLADYFRNGLDQIPNVKVLDKGTRKCGIVTASIQNWDAQAFKTQLEGRKINCSISGKNMALLDFNDKKVDWAIRFSPHYYNTLEEIDTALEVVAKLMKK